MKEGLKGKIKSMEGVRFDRRRHE